MELKEAMKRVDFARSRDQSRKNLTGFCVESSRVVACDGHCLVWQEFFPPTERTGLIDSTGSPIQGVEPIDYLGIIPVNPKIILSIPPFHDWLKALKGIANSVDRPFGEIAYDTEEGLQVKLNSFSPKVEAKLVVPASLVSNKGSFRVGINLYYLWKVMDTARKGMPTTNLRLAVFDPYLPIEVSNEFGFYSLTMTHSLDGVFISNG